MKFGPYRLTAKPDALIVPGIFFGFALYQYLFVKHLSNSKTNLVLIEPVFILLTLFTILVLTRNIKLKRDDQREETAVTPAPGEMNRRKQVRWFILITGLYVASIPILGFIISNLVFLATCMVFLQEKRWMLIILVPLVASAAVYLLFEVWIQASLPSGFWVYLR